MRTLLLASAAVVATAAVPASAQVYGDLASWQADVGTFSQDTMYGTNFTDITDLTLDDGTSMSFSTPMSIRTIGSGWATWSGGYTDQVLFTQGATSLTTTFTSGGSSAFGFFAQPNPFSVFDITMTLSDGSILTQAVDGSSGADFFGWAGPTVTSFTVSSAEDFAIGDFYSTGSAVPEPGTWALMLLGFFGIGAVMRRRKDNVTTTVRYA